ncbi:hypothetical protein J2X36_004285 [Methylobacterium sp. BE186]|nr:hypothetical protein [Methylobacterium sp. BE186]
MTADIAAMKIEITITGEIIQMALRGGARHFT